MCSLNLLFWCCRPIINGSLCRNRWWSRCWTVQRFGDATKYSANSAKIFGIAVMRLRWWTLNARTNIGKHKFLQTNCDCWQYQYFEHFREIFITLFLVFYSMVSFHRPNHDWLIHVTVMIYRQSNVIWKRKNCGINFTNWAPKWSSQKRDGKLIANTMTTIRKYYFSQNILWNSSFPKNCSNHRNRIPASCHEIDFNGNLHFQLKESNPLNDLVSSKAVKKSASNFIWWRWFALWHISTARTHTHTCTQTMSILTSQNPNDPYTMLNVDHRNQ